MNNALGLVETKGWSAPLKPPMQWLNPPTYSWWATKNWFWHGYRHGSRRCRRG